MSGPFLWIALDGLSEHADKTLAVMRELEKVEGNFGFKANLDWVLERGLGPARKALSSRPAFVDTKMWNGASTMARAFYNAHHAGFDLINAYALAGGVGASKQDGLELSESILMFRRKAPDSGLRIFAVTILTHYGDSYCKRVFGASESVVVRRLVEEGALGGADGVIMPGTYLPQLEDLKIRFCLPGIRPTWYSDNRHERETRPEEVAGRSDVEVVCGSPIMKTADPVGSLKKILDALKSKS